MITSRQFTAAQAAALPAAAGPYAGLFAWSFPLATRFRRIDKVKLIPDQTGATFDVTLWSFLLSFDNQREFRRVSCGSSPEILFDSNIQIQRIDFIIAYYAGVPITNLIADFCGVEIEAAN